MRNNRIRIVWEVVAAICLFAVLGESGFAQSRKADSGNHSQVQCAECHRLLANIDDHFSLDRIRDNKCQSCHLSKPASNPDWNLGFHNNQRTECVNCHSFHQTEIITAIDQKFEFSFNNKNLLLLCATCHSSSGRLDKLSDGHRLAADAVYHRDYRKEINLSASAACLSCHGEQNLNRTLDLMGFTPPVFNKEASHPFGIYFNPKSNNLSETDGEITLFDGKIECQTCHDLTSSTPDYLKYSGSYKDLCQVCHMPNR